MIADKVRDLVSSNAVVIFSKNNCVYCSRVQEYLQTTVGVPPSDMMKLNVEEAWDEDDMFELMDITGRSSFPVVFVGGELIGGYKEVVNMYQFDLEKLSTLLQSRGVNISDNF